MTGWGVAQEIREWAGRGADHVRIDYSFRAELFEALGGLDVDIGGREGDKNLESEQKELCARMREKYGRGVWLRSRGRDVR